jgi:hypothetical protein
MPAEILYSIIGGLLGVVAALVGALWTIYSGSTKKIFDKLDELFQTMHEIETGLRGDLVELDRRITRIETRLEQHNKP